MRWSSSIKWFLVDSLPRGGTMSRPTTILLRRAPSTRQIIARGKVSVRLDSKVSRSESERDQGGNPDEGSSSIQPSPRATTAKRRARHLQAPPSNSRAAVGHERRRLVACRMLPPPPLLATGRRGHPRKAPHGPCVTVLFAGASASPYCCRCAPRSRANRSCPTSPCSNSHG